MSVNTRAAKVSHRIARQIVSEIAERDLRPGDKLDAEAVMLARFGVGRPSLREALRILEDQGLIVLKPGPGGGPFVSELGSAHFARIASLYFQTAGATLRELGEALVVLDPVVARHAARRADDAGKKELREHLAQARGDMVERGRLVAHTDEFHHIVVRLSGNAVLGLVVTAVRQLYEERVIEPIYSMFSKGFHDRLERTLDEHEAIADAIIEGDGARAEALMQTHVLWFASVVEERFSELLDQVITWQ